MTATRTSSTHQEGSEADVVAKLVFHELGQPVVLGDQGVHPVLHLLRIPRGQALLNDIAGALVAAELKDVAAQLRPDIPPVTTSRSGAWPGLASCASNISPSWARTLQPELLSDLQFHIRML